MAGILRYVEGAKPGKKLKISSDREANTASIAEKRKVYENKKRVRKFMPEWTKDRPWLKYIDGHMFCECCKENDEVGTFCSGTTNFKLDAVKQHECSKSHVKHAAKYTRPAKETSKAADCLMRLKKSEYDRLSIKFRTSHALAKSNHSFRFYSTLCRLDKAKGLDLGNSYMHDKAAAEFVHNIASVTQDTVCEKIKKSNYVSFTCDGSTDFTGEDLENIYVRTVVDGQVEDSFLFIGSSESASSADIFEFLMKTFADLSLDIQNKLIGFCADGASNMQGMKTGLAALLKKKWPNIFITHCLAHRLELAFKDAIKKKSSIYDRVSTLLMGLYYLYRKSPKQKKHLQRSFEALDMKAILPTRIGGTRWLPHLQRALNAFTKGYRAIIFQLENSSHENPKAEGLAKLAGDGSVIVFSLQLKMIISILARLSLFLQQKELCIGDAYQRVFVTKIQLQQAINEECEEISKVLDTGEYQGHRVTFKGRRPSAKVPSELVNALSSAIDTRFPMSSSVVNATLIANFNTWPEPSDDYSDFGKTDIQELYKHFVTSDEDKLQTVLEEWQCLKSLVYTEFKSELQKGNLVWPRIIRRFGEGISLKNILDLVSIVRCLPPTSVCNETTFSAMKLIKSKRRGHLRNRMLNDLMLIHLQSPDIEEFDPQPSIQRWMITPSGRKRRLAYTRGRVQPVVETLTQKTETSKHVTSTTQTEVDTGDNTTQTETVDKAHCDTQTASTDIQMVATSSSQTDTRTWEEQERELQVQKYSDSESDSDYESDNEMTEREVDNFLFSCVLRE